MQGKTLVQETWYKIEIIVPAYATQFISGSLKNMNILFGFIKQENAFRQVTATSFLE